MNPTESPSNHGALDGPLEQVLPESDIKLMAIAEVLHQDDIELLKQQLSAAHQLLTYQQDVVHALTEQINLKEICLSQTEQKAAELKHQCDYQQIELAEVQSVCSDLRELLKRQQRRSPSQVSHSRVNNSDHVFRVKARDLPQQDSISFGYESGGYSGQATQPLTKAPPVEAWSATQSNQRQDEAIFCQRLTTFVLAPPTQISAMSSHPVIDVSAQIVSHNPAVSQRRPVELPRFAMS